MDKSSSLTEAKNLLEFTFFCGRVSFESEIDAKLWLDERRAHEVNRAVSTPSMELYSNLLNLSHCFRFGY